MRYDNGGELLVALLRELGVDTVFGIVSVHNLPLVEAVDRELRFVPVRHEAGAVSAADGYGRASGGIGCALTSTGTGAGNAAGSLIESLSAGTSVLHITGQVASAYLGGGRGYIHETKDQLGMLTAVSVYAAGVSSARTAGDTLRAAAHAALTMPGGPASVEWPIDLQYAPQTDAVPDGSTERHRGRHTLTRPAVARRSAPAFPPVPSSDELTKAGDLLATARRPLIWAGGGAAEAGGQLTELLEAAGAGLLTSNSGRGCVPEDHPQVIGNFATTPPVRTLLAEADVLLSVGTHFRSNETADYDLLPPSEHIQIDLDVAALGRVYPARHPLHGDAATVLRHLLPHVGRAEPGWTARVRDVRAEVRAELHDGIGPQAAICTAIRAALPRRAVIARDVTIPSSTWGNRLLEMYDARDNLFPRGGGIGQGLGMGLGAALARPDTPTLVLVGDGGLAVHLGELLTLAQERPRLTLMVFNDGGYGVLRNMQDRHSQRRSGVDLATPEFEALAGACGLDYLRIGLPEHAAPVLQAAVTADGPTLVEVDLRTLGPMKQPFTPPVRIHSTPQEQS